MAPAPFCRLGLQFCGAAAAILVPMVGEGWKGGGERHTPKGTRKSSIDGGSERNSLGSYS